MCSNSLTISTPYINFHFQLIQFQQITSAFQTAERENDTIYHDTVPSDAKLPQIEKKTIVKPTPIPAWVFEKDPFGKLIPFAITEKLSVYQVIECDSNYLFLARRGKTP